MNNVNLQAIQNTQEQIKKGEFPAERDFIVEGEWITDQNADAQFRANVEFPQGSVTLRSDQPPPAGGQGRHPNPIQYCAFGVVSCYATTFVTLATMKGIRIESLRVRGGIRVNMKSVMEVEPGPPNLGVWVELEVKSDATPQQLEELRKETDEKCPAAFTIRNSVPFTSTIKKV